MSNYFVQELVLYRHFMLIDSPIPFELIANPTNFRKDEHGNILNTDLSEITGRDICSRPAGAWRIDCWTLLPEKYHKQNPVFTMLIKYDKDLLEEGEVVDVRYSDIDIGEGVAGVNGQLVSIPASDFHPVVLAINDVSSNLSKILPHSFIRTVDEFRDFAFSLTANSGFLVSGLFVIQIATGIVSISGLFDLSTFRVSDDFVGFYLRSLFVEGVYASDVDTAGVSVKSCDFTITVIPSDIFSYGNVFVSGGSMTRIPFSSAGEFSTINFGFVG